MPSVVPDSLRHLGQPMQFQVQLFVRALHNGFFTMQVIGEPKLCVYTEDLDQAREDLTLVLNDRIERMNPGELGKHTAARDYVVHDLELEEGLIVEGALGPETHPTKVSVLESRDRRWRRLWLPRWDVRLWIPVKGDLEEAVRELLAGYLGKKSDHDRLELRLEGKEWVEGLTIEAERAPLSAFTGAFFGARMLPSPAEKADKKNEDDEDEDEDDEDGQDKDKKHGGKGKKNKKKKKRPPTPTLKRLGTNMALMAREGELEHAFGRDKEVGELLSMINKVGTSVAVVGEPGVGKTTVLAELVHQIVSKKRPKKLRTRPVFFVDASRLIAGDGWFGDWQRQCLDVIQECIDAEVIWYIGPLLPLLDAGKSIGSQQNVSLLLKPFLAGKRLTIVGECTPKNWAQLELRDAGFSRLFTPFQLQEPSPDQSRHILAAVAGELSTDIGVEVQADGLRAIEALCRRFGSDESYLGRSIHFLRRLVDDAYTMDQEEVGRGEVVSQFCSETGLPEFIVRDDIPLDPETVYMAFRRRLIGQEEAVRRMTDLVAMVKAGLSDLRRPLGSFLFVGPTGVGKTEMAKAMAEFLFGRTDRLIRFDMSEFVTPDSVQRFLGGAGQEGKLVSEIRRQPFCVLLLDEIEKAHPAVFDVLLQVLGEARLTDQLGRTADFRNAVVLMTSNLGVATMRDAMGFGGEGEEATYKDHFLAEAERFFRPEFIGRLDYIVPFEPLRSKAIDQITGREIAHFLAREGIRQRELEVGLGEGVQGWLAKRGVEPRYGARPLKRLIERTLAAPMARHLSGLRPNVAHSLAVSVDEAGELAFSNIEAGSGEGSSARGRVLKVLRRMGLVRYQAELWRQSSPYRELVQDIRLLERLSQDRNFWKDRARADERMRHHDAERTLRDEFQALCERLASIEDLTYELLYDRNAEPLEELEGELGEALEGLRGLEWRLYARRFFNPHKAALYFLPTNNARPCLDTLVKLYLALAEERGWKVKGQVVRIPLPKTPQREKRRPENAPIPARPPKSRIKKKDMKEAFWKALSKPFEANPDSEKATRTARDAFSREFVYDHDTRRPRALIFEGPFAACWLSRESGAHHLIQPGEPPEFVKVRFQGLVGIQGLDAPTLLSTRWPDKRHRVIHHGQHLVHDNELGVHHPTEPRLYRVYARFMRAHLYDVVFGHGAHKLFEER